LATVMMPGVNTVPHRSHLKGIGITRAYMCPCVESIVGTGKQSRKVERQKSSGCLRKFLFCSHHLPMESLSRSAPYGWLPGKEHYRPVRSLFDCALYKINLKAVCWQCRHSSIIDAPGHWWRCHRLGLDDNVKAFHSRLFCMSCFRRTKLKVRQPSLQQTNESVHGVLMPGPDEYTWKRIVNSQRG